MKKRILVLVLLLLLGGLVSAQDTQTPYEIALERIAAAHASDATELSLHSLGLTALPPEIGNLTNLQVLYLAYNQLSTLPSEIGNLANLQGLALAYNQLSTLPPEIGNLTSLQSLYLGGNELSVLPPEIGNLHNLQGIYLNNNQLNTLVPEIGNLSNLQELYLNDNQLNTLPLEMGRLTHLKYIEISGNPLTDLPSAVVEQGNNAVLAYLRDEYARREGEKQRLLVMGTSSIGLFTALLLGFRMNQRSQRKPKKKRDMVDIGLMA